MSAKRPLLSDVTTDGHKLPHLRLPSATIQTDDSKDDDGFSEAVDDAERVQRMCFCRRLWQKYDRMFLTVYGV